MDPSHSGIKGFEPFQLQELLKKAVVQEKGSTFAALRQMSLYILQFWGVARFVEIQNLKMGHLVRGIDHFDLVLSRLGGGITRQRNVTPIYPTPTKFQKTFCPVTILSNYCKARNDLCKNEDNDFLFPKMTLSFELGTNKHNLAIAIPHECIPTLAFMKKFKSHVKSEEFQKVGVNSIEFTPDSLKLGGQNCLNNGVVSPDFSQNPTHPAQV